MAEGRHALLAVLVAAAVSVGGPALASGSKGGGQPDPHNATFEEVVDYYESGRFAKDTARVAKRARKFLRKRLGGKPSRGHHAIVFDIDDTLLSTYECQRKHGDFGSTELALCLIEETAQTTTGAGPGLPPIEPVRRLYNLAQRLRVRVFLITGRPELLRRHSIDNLRARGFRGNFKLTMQDTVGFLDNTLNGKSLVPYKAGERARIERSGWRILVNIGDQQSDLDGGHARRTYKVPNPMYFTP